MIGSTRYTASLEVRRQAALSADITRLNTSITSKQRLSAASDDPKAASRISDIRQLQADNAAWTRNVDIGAGIAKAADNALTSLSTMVQRAKELIIAGSNDTNANVNRADIAAELRSIAGEITALSQTRDPNGQPLFPAGDPLNIPISNGRSIAATASSKQVFGTVATAQGDRSIADILTFAADALGLDFADPEAKLPYTDKDGNTVDANGEPLTMTRAQAIAASVTNIGQSDDHVLAMQTDQGIRAKRFDDEKTGITAGNLDLTEERAGLEETDLPSAITEYQGKSLALQAAQQMFAQTHQKSLFDLIG
jgi:flagellar hook-associated protein 3 FlgL